MKPPHILYPPKLLCPTFDLFNVEGDPNPIFLVRTRVGMAVGMFSLSRQGGVERGGGRAINHWQLGTQPTTYIQADFKVAKG